MDQRPNEWKTITISPSMVDSPKGSYRCPSMADSLKGPYRCSSMADSLKAPYCCLSNVRLLFLQIRGGNSLVLDGDFSSYFDLTLNGGPVPVLGSWHVSVVDTAAPAFQYISVQSMHSTNNYLQLLEVQVYVN